MSVTVKRKRGRPRRDEPRAINDFDLSLIQEFQRRPAFYDRTHPQYRNREFLEPQWAEMGRNLGYDVSLVKDRMLQLRNRYNLEKRRVEALQEQYQDPDVTSQWALYDSLTFLGDHIKTRRPFVNTTSATHKQIQSLRPKMQPASNSSDAEDYDDSQQLINGSASASDSEIIVHSAEKAAEVYAKMAPQQLRLKVRNPLEVNTVNSGIDKFKAFGQFLASSLIEMNENDALRLVEKFTSDLVKSLMAEHNSNVCLNVEC